MAKGNVVSQCSGCVRQINGRCLTFNEPVQVWRDGSCWAYTTDEEQIRREREQVAWYARWKSGRPVRGAIWW